MVILVASPQLAHRRAAHSSVKTALPLGAAHSTPIQLGRGESLSHMASQATALRFAPSSCFGTGQPVRQQQRQAAQVPAGLRRQRQRRCAASRVAAATAAAAAAAAAPQYPAFMPAEVADIEEPAAQRMLAAMQRVSLEVPGLGAVQTAYVGPAAPSPARPAFVLLHGFDSSSLEFRRFHPLLSQVGDVYAVDLAGWGFTDCGFSGPDAERIALGPPQKRAHLRAFLQQVVGRPVTLVGTSLGGTVAIDYATNHPDDLDRLVLIDAQVGWWGRKGAGGAGGRTGRLAGLCLFCNRSPSSPQPGTPAAAAIACPIDLPACLPACAGVH